MPDEELTFNECIDDAVLAIKDALAKLDLSHTYCPVCNSRRFHNFNEKKEGDILAGTLVRLETLATTRAKRKE